MNKNELVKAILKNIQDISSIKPRFDDASKIHQIDIDLALSKVRNLYDLLLNINSTDTYIPDYKEEEILTNSEQVEVKPARPAGGIEESPKKEIIKETVEEPKIIEEVIPEPEFTIEKPSGDDSKTEHKSETTVHELKQNGNSPEILADKFQSKKFVHDNISKTNLKKDVSAKMQSKPIKDINAGIGLNDKFIFIRELFENNKEHYHETIQVLNNFDTYENALEFLKENFNWEQDNPNFERLKELVRRKYI